MRSLSNRTVHILILVLVVLTSLGCQSGPNLDRLRSEILELHRSTIAAHWDKSIDFFIQDISDDYFTVQGGEILRQTKEEVRSRFTDYLTSTTFSEYRDLSDPIIRVSRDGSMAWSIVQVKIAGKHMTDEGNVRDLDFTCAWITLYERQGNRWIRLGEVSTFN